MRFRVDRCQYKMASTNNWEIDVRSENCGQWSTCKKRLSITVGGFLIEAVGTSVTVNGVPLKQKEGYVNGGNVDHDR